MRLIPSNSGCCGVRYIRDFPAPHRILMENSEDNYDYKVNDTTEPKAYLDISPPRPSETAEERFLSLVQACKDRQAAGIIQCYVAANGDSSGRTLEEASCQDCGCIAHCESLLLWRPIFEKAGFEEQLFFNSNSENDCAVFTLVYGSRDGYFEDSYNSTDEDYDF